MKHRSNENGSNNDDCQTPQYIYGPLHQEFDFDFDPCPLYYRLDGLTIEWGKRNFINPPYSRKLKEAFILKAYEESKKGKLCVMLLPVSTSTKIFHKVIYPHADILFIEGRIKFRGYNSKGVWTENKSGQHDSMIVIFSPNPIARAREKAISQLPNAKSNEAAATQANSNSTNDKEVI